MWDSKRDLLDHVGKAERNDDRDEGNDDEGEQPRSSAATRLKHCAESFWTTVKVEFYDRYLWPTRAAAKLPVGDWIERVYNRRRRHSALGMISPVEYEDRFTQTAQAA